jgi:hypothetical protein
MMKIPTLSELLARFKKAEAYKMPLKQAYNLVAAGIRDPEKKPLPKNMIVLASQAMVILFKAAEDDQVAQKLMAADRLSAAVDIMVRNNALGERTLVSDVRLEYGEPFSNERLNEIFPQYP